MLVQPAEDDCERFVVESRGDHNLPTHTRGSLFNQREKPRGLEAEAAGQLHDVDKTNVSLSPFDATHIISVKVRDFR